MTSDRPEPESLQDRIKRVQQQAARIAEQNAEAAEKPLASRKPYATVEYATQMIRVLHKWDESGRKKLKLRAETFGWTFAKLRAFVYNSRAYIRDDSGSSPELLALLAAARFVAQSADESMIIMDSGVRTLETIEDIAAGLESVTDGTDGLRAELIQWLSDDRVIGDQFYKTDLKLSSSDVDYFRTRAAEIADIYTTFVGRDMLRFVRGSVDELRAWREARKAGDGSEPV